MFSGWFLYPKDSWYPWHWYVPADVTCPPCQGSHDIWYDIHLGYARSFQNFVRSKKCQDFSISPICQNMPQYVGKRQKMWRANEEKCRHRIQGDLTGIMIKNFMTIIVKEMASFYDINLRVKKRYFKNLRLWPKNWFFLIILPILRILLISRWISYFWCFIYF